MLPVETLLTFAFTSVLLAFAPGPDNLFVLTQSAMKGVRAGIYVTFGLATGLVVHTAAVVLGLAALIQVSTVAFTVLKIVGAGYLLYLAWGALRAKPEIAGDGEDAGLSGIQYYKRGIIMNVTNPKVSIFFLAFLPQFVSPAAGDITMQMLTLAFVFFLVTIVVFSLFAMLSGFLGAKLAKSAKTQNVLNKIAGFVFIGLAAKLLASKA